MSDSVQFGLREGLELAGGDLEQLWWRYLGLGGRANIALFAVRVNMEQECSVREHNLIAQALNEYFIDLGVRTFPVGYLQMPMPSDIWPQGTTGVRYGLSAAAAARRRARAARTRSEAVLRRAATLQLLAASLSEFSGLSVGPADVGRRAAAARQRAARLAGLG